MTSAVTWAAKGVDVRVLEAADTLGSGTRGSELTLPDLVHDDCSAAHPLAVDTPFSRQFDFAAHGLTWRWPELQYSHPLDGGRGAATYRSVEATAAGLGAGGRSWRAVFAGDRALRRHQRRLPAADAPVPAHPVKLARFGLAAAMPAALLARRFATPDSQALFAGVAAHAFWPFGTPMPSAIGVALGTAAHRYAR